MRSSSQFVKYFFVLSFGDMDKVSGWKTKNLFAWCISVLLYHWFVSKVKNSQNHRPLYSYRFYCLEWVLTLMSRTIHCCINIATATLCTAHGTQYSSSIEVKICIMVSSSRGTVVFLNHSVFYWICVQRMHDNQGGGKRDSCTPKYFARTLRVSLFTPWW